MKPAPHLASGPWPCYTLDWKELGVILESQGTDAIDQDGNPLCPNGERISVIDAVLKTLGE